MSRVIKKFKLPAETATPGLRPMKSKDAPAIRKLLNEYMDKFNFVPVFKSDEEVRHWLLPKEGVIWSYVVEVRMVMLHVYTNVTVIVKGMLFYFIFAFVITPF